MPSQGARPPGKYLIFAGISMMKIPGQGGKRMQPDSPRGGRNWLNRYGIIFGVSLDESMFALANNLGYAQGRKVNCQARDCGRLGAPFILPVGDKLVVLRYLCDEHWLQAAEEAFYGTTISEIGETL